MAAGGRRLPSLLPPLPGSAWAVLGAVFLLFAGSGAITPYLAVYLTQARGHGAAAAGLVTAVVGAAAFVGNPQMGRLVDAWGARRAMPVGAGAAVVGVLWLSQAETVGGAVAAAAVLGLGQKACLRCLTARLASVVVAKDRANASAVHHVVLNAGYGLGALGAGLFLEQREIGSYLSVWWCAAAAIGAAPLVLLLTPADEARGVLPPVGAGRFGPLAHDAQFRRTWLIWFVFAVVGVHQFVLALPLFMVALGGMSARDVGWVLAVNTGGAVVLQLAVLPFLDGRRRDRLAVLSFALLAVAWVLAALAGAAPRGALVLYGATALVVAAAQTLLSPAVPSAVPDLAPAGQLGRYMASFSLTNPAATAVAPAMAGAALGAGLGTSYLLGLAAGSLAAAVPARRWGSRLPDRLRRLQAGRAG